MTIKQLIGILNNHSPDALVFAKVDDDDIKNITSAYEDEDADLVICFE